MTPIPTNKGLLIPVVVPVDAPLFLNEAWKHDVHNLNLWMALILKSHYSVKEIMKMKPVFVGTIQHPGVCSFDPAPFVQKGKAPADLYWRDYMSKRSWHDKECYTMDTPHDSFLSRLASWGYYWDNPLGEKESCPEFPYFGAHYPDARCIGGELWDLDKYEDGQLYSTGDNPVCPFCRTDDFMQEQKDNEEDLDAVREWMQRIRDRYGDKAWQEAESRKLSVDQMVVLIQVNKV